MGSFSSKPKNINVDYQDDGFEIPKGLTTTELLQHVKVLRGEDQPQLLSRQFLKDIIAEWETDDVTEDHHFEDVNSLSEGESEKYTDSCTARAPNQIRLLQWNILSQTLGQNTDCFTCCPDQALTWDNRKFLIVQEILQYNPDIACLQEVDHFKFLQTVLGTQNYEGIFFPKPDSPCLYIKKNNGPDGCAIFYKNDKFELKGCDKHVLEVCELKSNHVAIAVNLMIRESGKELCVCTTHLKARRGPLPLKWRNEQGSDLVWFLKQSAGNRPILLCGDFNAEPIEPVYRTILTCDLKLSSAYADLQMEIFSTPSTSTDEENEDNPNTNNVNDELNKVRKSIRHEPAYTSWKIRSEGEECYTIDYIFYTKDDFKVNDCLEFPQADAMGKDRTPSFQYPSDHFSLVCDFEFKTKISEKTL